MIPYSTQCIDEDDISAVVSTLQSSNLTQGVQTELFEQELAQYLGVPYVLSFNSATSALFCAYRALGLAHCEVITSPISFVATSNMLLENHAQPVFCDIMSNGNINPHKIPELITPKTKAIVSIDYAGASVDVEAIAQIAKEYQLAFVSDSSHSFGGEYQGTKIGAFADLTIFSFHALKPITTGEGGAIATKDAKLYERIKRIRSHGVIKKSLWNTQVQESGFNFRLTDIAASLGRSQLKKIDTFIQQRQKIASFYDEVFKDNPYFHTLQIPSHIKSSIHLYPIFLKQQYWCAKEAIFARLQERGLGVQVHYKPIHLYDLYAKTPHRSLYQAERFYNAQISIPCHQKMDIPLAQEVAEILLDTLEGF
ncbi:UDP-4-amino-4,6-dideoxy-N-acetyl-beta-L-altrosamine transaminase [Helicobacter enhydrae]|uniref:UDP-4-amino-4,6-dideoxy-N-acetyl-beta-L-altrosamine transaminase n=1 Tax=Helicobacter enhydrae TaxID=222136 RepID=A0A1B1U6W5_9HELI|nr:UDP-4-amino-4,6-dideoxy-N-acetyl-beta-L-altrosamine transaminase [Helicobacter enhydrae]ANV98547.1 UDP-4-amino-4,6-dideoxy-N-acetyl-beta-L-altrosamine transaminase [Helicobacter enhydrae]